MVITINFQTLLNHLLVFFGIYLGAFPVLGQSYEPFAIRYGWLPQVQVNEADEDLYESAERQPLHTIDAVLRLPIRIGEQGFVLVPNTSYTRVYQSLDNWAFTGDRPGDASQFGVGLSALWPVSKRVSLIGSIGIDQGTNDGISWSTSNNLYKGGLGFLLNMEEGYKPYKMGITLFYTEVLGFPIAVLVYKRQISEKWSVDFALPNYGIIDYTLGKKTKLRFEERFAAGRFALGENENDLASYNLSRVTLTAGIVQQVKGPVSVQASAGFTIWNRSVLFDEDNGRLDVLLYEIPQPALSIGLMVNVSSDDNK